ECGTSGGIARPAAFGFLYGRHHLELTRAQIDVSAMPPALDGLRIGLLTDIHRSRWVSHEDVVRAVDMLMAERPDLVILGGDFVTEGDRDYAEPAAEALATL